MLAGYGVITASDFHTAREQLDAHAPDLLVSDVKLEAYNGLHLAIWASGRHLPTRTVLIGDPDSVLQREAEREQALFLPLPLEESTFRDAVRVVFDVMPPTRRFPRKRVDVQALVDTVVASVLDVSYSGVRLAIDRADAIAFPRFFTVQLGSAGVAYRVQRVWTRRDQASPERLVCGARLPNVEGQSAHSWRVLVDGLGSCDTLPVETDPDATHYQREPNQRRAILSAPESPSGFPGGD